MCNAVSILFNSKLSFVLVGVEPRWAHVRARANIWHAWVRFSSCLWKRQTVVSFSILYATSNFLQVGLHQLFSQPGHFRFQCFLLLWFAIFCVYQQQYWSWPQKILVPRSERLVWSQCASAFSLGEIWSQSLHWGHCWTPCQCFQACSVWLFLDFKCLIGSSSNIGSCLLYLVNLVHVGLAKMHP